MIGRLASVLRKIEAAVFWVGCRVAGARQWCEAKERARAEIDRLAQLWGLVPCPAHRWHDVTSTQDQLDGIDRYLCLKCPEERVTPRAGEAVQ